MYTAIRIIHHNSFFLLLTLALIPNQCIFIVKSLAIHLHDTSNSPFLSVMLALILEQ